MTINITDIELTQHPFILGDRIIYSPINSSSLNKFILEAPNLFITGNILNTKTGKTEKYIEQEIINNTYKSGNTVIASYPLTFIGHICISFTSMYPLKTYPTINKFRNQLIGQAKFGYQSHLAEIRYNFGGKGIVYSTSSLYKNPIVIYHNIAGSDNTLLNYKIFYNGKKSETRSVHINIKKTNNKFYSHDENG